MVERTSEAVTAASSCVSGNCLMKCKNNMEEVMDDHSRIFNGDETGFQIRPSTGRVLAEKGGKNVYLFDEGSSKENITVIFSFSANGKKMSNYCVSLRKDS